MSNILHYTHTNQAWDMRRFPSILLSSCSNNNWSEFIWMSFTCFASIDNFEHVVFTEQWQWIHKFLVCLSIIVAVRGELNVWLFDHFDVRYAWNSTKQLIDLCKRCRSFHSNMFLTIYCDNVFNVWIGDNVLGWSMKISMMHLSHIISTKEFIIIVLEQWIQISQHWKLVLIIMM